MATATTATQLTVSEAAEHVGVTRQTIFKQIKAGKLSATQNRQGHLQVNVVELMRVYGELQSPQQVAQNRLNRQQQAPGATATPLLQLELERAKLQLEKKEFELEQMRARVEEMRERERATTEERMRLFGIIERQSLLLAAPKPPRAPARPKAAPAPAPVVKKPAAKAVAKTSTVPKAKPAAAKKTVAKVPTRSPKAAPKKATRK